jgi:hypothetical protein
MRLVSPIVIPAAGTSETPGSFTISKKPGEGSSSGFSHSSVTTVPRGTNLGGAL